MVQVGGAFVRLRPSLKPEDRSALELLGKQARDLADGVDTFLAAFAREPDDQPSLKETHD